MFDGKHKFLICFHIKSSTDFQQVWRLLNYRITCVPVGIIVANNGNSLSCQIQHFQRQSNVFRIRIIYWLNAETTITHQAVIRE